ncbi:hypothetical protein [Micromonospora sp. MA102]|uniref:hypothetical protein n=1 Tax=Micromonospora sp. MA102 TaxID=2952755 RepID=UPI0021C680EE|nr:hypothetical protein [Micromonospora sp. MA102]
MENVVEYTWRLNDGEPAAVPAGADCAATITRTPTEVGDNYLYVSSRTVANPD